MRGELPEDGGVAIRIAIALAAQDVERADRLRLVHQRHGHRGRHAGHDFDVVRVGRDVADDQRLLRRRRRGRRGPCDSAQLEAGGIRIADGVADAELAALLVEQVDGERVELDEPADELGNPLAGARRSR